MLSQQEREEAYNKRASRAALLRISPAEMNSRTQALKDAINEAMNTVHQAFYDAAKTITTISAAVAKAEEAAFTLRRYSDPKDVEALEAALVALRDWRPALVHCQAVIDERGLAGAHNAKTAVVEAAEKCG